MADQAEGGAENVKSESVPISIIVRGQDQQSNEVHFKIKTHTRFEKVFNAYCEKKAQDPRAVKFLFDGQRVNPHQTPSEFGMEDGDVIDVMIEQLGGAATAR